MPQRCWACGSACCPPQDSPGALFKCGWCHALNSVNSAAGASADPAAPTLQLGQPRRGRRACLPFAAGCVLICVVVAIIGSIFVLGLSLVLPALVGPLPLAVLHGPLAAWLVLGIFYNYAACVARPPGPVARHLAAAVLDAGGRVRRGALEGCRYCDKCTFYKPSGAHHCSACGCCVMDLDHHCFYISNCVGAANLRHFLLLLWYVVGGAAYGLAAGLALCWHDRRALAQHTQRVISALSRFHPVMRLLSFCLYWLLAAPHWLACLAYFVAVCWAATVAVGLLLRRQLRLLLRGQSYLETLRARRPRHEQQQQQQLQAWQQAAPVAAIAGDGPAAAVLVAAVAGDGPAAAAPSETPTEQAGTASAQAAGPSPGWHNVRRVFGGGHPLTWLLPAWDVPPGATDSDARLKLS